MQRLKNFLDVFNVPAATFGVSFTYADTMAKALGIQGASVISTETRVVTIAGVSRTIGIAGLITSGVALRIAMTDGTITCNDWLNVLGLLGAFGSLVPIAWISLPSAIGSAAITFYTTAHPDPENPSHHPNPLTCF